MSSASHVRLRRAAMDMLARREHCAVEMRAKLARLGGDPELIDAVVQQLGAEGLQSDARFAEALVRMHKGRGHGPMRILRELETRGVGRELAEHAVEPRAAEWLELARQWRARRFGAELPASAAEWQRQARHLQQRGFSGEQVRHALRAAE